MIEYLSYVRSLIRSFKRFELNGSLEITIQKQIPCLNLHHLWLLNLEGQSTSTKVKEIMSDNFSSSWMTPLIQYLKGNLMPVNPPEARTHKCHTNSLYMVICSSDEAPPRQTWIHTLTILHCNKWTNSSERYMREDMVIIKTVKVSHSKLFDNAFTSWW